MSLVLYTDDNDHTDHEYRVILDNRNKKTLVLQNKLTNEVSLINNHKHNTISNLNETAVYPLRCPHCGSFLDSNTPSNASGGDTDDYSFMHSNYFKLLAESNIQTNEAASSSKGSSLPTTIFTQGYYYKFFKQLSLLGRGSRGSVYKVEHILNNVPLGVFALKKITIGEDPKWLMKVLHEVHMLVKISSNNPNLVSYNHVWLEVDSINDFGPKVPCAFILQQYCSGGNLEDFINWLKDPKLSVKQMKKLKVREVKGRLLTSEEILIIFLQIVNGVLELHKHHIIHRDLKPSNCLLAQEYLTVQDLKPDIENLPTVLIGDFGESQIEGSKRSKSGTTGTLEYCAPELIYEMKEFNKKTDSYSLGMILYFICFSELPFHSKDLNDLKDEIINIDILREDLKRKRSDLHSGFIDLILNLTQKDANRRLESNEILNELNEISMNLKETETPITGVASRKLSLDDQAPPIAVDQYHEGYKRYVLVTLQLVLLAVLLGHKLDESIKYLVVFFNGLSITSNYNKFSYALLIIMVLINLYGYI